jgi:hypothetical protein
MYIRLIYTNSKNRSIYHKRWEHSYVTLRPFFQKNEQGTDVMILKIFPPKTLAFFGETTAIFAKN